MSRPLLVGLPGSIEDRRKADKEYRDQETQNPFAPNVRCENEQVKPSHIRFRSGRFSHAAPADRR